MKKTFGKHFMAPLAALILSSFILAPIAEARGGGGGGGGGARANAGGGGARAGGGDRQINNSQRDVRTNDVRNTSVNNVNSSRNTNVSSSRNVNVNVDNNGCCGGGWDNDYHPVAAAAVVTATAVAIGSMVRSVPANCVPVNYGGIVYQQCGSTWYQPQGGQYQVIAPPY